ncbi:MAG: EamA family transporter [Thermosipho sp. (in: Bacteria)]|nr:EamA family transporter [Thermosipho sp. (in: thermotogales)]
MVFLWMSLRILFLGFERIVGKEITKGSSALLSSWGFFGFALLSLSPFATRLSVDILKISLISGSIYSVSFFLYIYALSKEEVSVVAPLYNINAIFLIFITAIFLGEKITIYKLVGSFMMIYGVSYLKKSKNFVKSYKSILNSPGAVSMIFSSLLMAVGRTVDGFLTKQEKYDQVGYSVAIYLVMTVYFFLVSFFREKSFKSYFKFVGKKWKLLILGGICNAYAYVALLNAFKFIDVSIAEPISMVSALISIIFAYFFFNERIKLRFVGTLFLIFGAFIIYNG